METVPLVALEHLHRLQALLLPMPVVVVVVLMEVALATALVALADQVVADQAVEMVEQMVRLTQVVALAAVAQEIK
jgi:hypothetical protein